MTIKLPHLTLAAAAIIGCGDPASPTLPTGDITIVQGAVAQGSKGFSPTSLVKNLSAGATVTWVNADYSADPGGDMMGDMMSGSMGTAHRLISDEGLFDSGTVDPTQTFSYTFPGAGTYHYHCLNHPGMTGMVTIAP
jgi:plastocyanin